MNNFIEATEFYQKNGYFVKEAIFEKSIIEKLKNEANDNCVVNKEEFVVEKDGSPNSIWDIHLLSKTCREVSIAQNVIHFVRNFLEDEKIYIHQSKINFKAAFCGRDVRWHQDFTFWHHLDGMPEPRALTAALFLDDISYYNAPLFVIPRSHIENQKLGITREIKDSQHQEGKTGNVIPELTYEIDNEHLRRLADKNGIISICGKAGTICFFHCNIVHGSTNNISPYSRNILFITYNSISNKLRQIPNPRASYIAKREYSIIE